MEKVIWYSLLGYIPVSCDTLALLVLQPGVTRQPLHRIYFSYIRITKPQDIQSHFKRRNIGCSFSCLTEKRRTNAPSEAVPALLRTLRVGEVRETIAVIMAFIKSNYNSLNQCFSAAGPRSGTGPWHQLYRAARICHFSFLSIFYQ
jgi:hypothetical protein